MNDLITRVGADLIDDREAWWVEVLSDGKLVASVAELPSKEVAIRAKAFLVNGLRCGFYPA